MASAHVKQLHKKLAELDAQLADINAKRSIILEMIEEENPTPKKTPARRASVKKHVIDLLTEVKSIGLNAALAVDMAKDKGLDLDRGSVSSLLSRLKTDGAVTYDEDGKYRLADFPRDTKPTLGGSVTPIRNSGAYS